MSSSSECVYDSFNPEAACRRLVNLSVEHFDGTEEIVPAGRVVLAGGANVSFGIIENEEEAALHVLAGEGFEDQYYRDKFNALASIGPGDISSGESVAPDQDAWVFTEQSLWLSTINGQSPDPNSAAFFLLGDACMSVGEFEDETLGYPQAPRDCEYPSSEEGSGECGAELGLVDICAPCLDCQTYERFNEYLTRLVEFYDYIEALASNTTTYNPVADPDGAVRRAFSGTLPQLQATLRFWDYLVNTSTVKLSAQSQGQSVVAAGFYRNISDHSVGDGGDGVTMVITMTFQRVDGGGAVTDWLGLQAALSDVRVLDRDNRCSAVLGGSGITYPTGATVVVTMNSGGDMDSGEELFADVALVLKNTSLFHDPVYTYQVLVELDVSHTHLGPLVSDNPVHKELIVYFQPPDAAPST